MSTADPAAFAAELLGVIFDGVDNDMLDADAIEEMAERHGLILFRKPTPAELGDPAWWGHACGITESDETVMELAPDFLSMIPNDETVAAA